MREILFRGKQEDNGEWVYGYLHITHTREYEIGAYNKDINIERWMHVVDPSTVGQYTGLADKYSIEIFEGDIVDLFGMKGKIVQEYGAFGIGFEHLVDYDLLESNISYSDPPRFTYNGCFISLWELWWNFERYEQNDNLLYEVEVIGNIHDNPELLEETT